MASWRGLRGLFGLNASAPKSTNLTAPKPGAQFSLDVPPDLIAAITGHGDLAAPISRNEALQVPAVLRSRNLICSSLATLPLCVYGPDKRKVTDTTYLVGSQIDQDVANSVVMSQTLEDLLFHGIAWWRITAWGWHGYPTAARWIPHGSVLVANSHSLLPSQMIITDDELFPAPGDGGVVYVDGRPVPDRELIRFDSPNPPLLRHAARAIRTCLLLDQAAATYAKEPLPLGYFAPKDGAETLETEDVQELLDDWEKARRARAWGYVNGALDAKTLQWNPEQLQLADQRQHAVLEIARAAGVDPEYLGVSTTSRTYANIEDQRQDLLTFTLAPYVAAIEDRLSMRDVLPRGYCAELEFRKFLRADTKTRMETYQLGLAVGAYTKPEIRDMEDQPPLTAAEQAAAQPPATPPAGGTPAPAGAQQGRPPMGTVNFAAGETVKLNFPRLDSAKFQVDVEKRTVTGPILPWGQIGDNGRKWRFASGSVALPDDPSRVKLNLNHTDQLVGVATRLQSGRDALYGTYKLGRGPAADQALMDAQDGILDGFSVEVSFDNPDAYEVDPDDDSVLLVTAARLRGTALTGTPAFDNARVATVHASRNEEHITMGTTAATGGQSEATGVVDFDAHLSDLASKMADSHKQLTEGLAASIGESISAGVKAALENITTPQDGPQPVRAARYTITREAPVYSLDGRGASLVRDAWYSVRERDDEAIERLRKFRVQTDELSKFARSALSFMGGRAQFTTVSTGTASQVIPPGYRPDLFVPMLAQGRPMVNACSQGSIENATPFVVPTFTSFSGATGDNVEGTNPTDGSLSLGTKTVTPTAISGRMVLTREIVDSSNPAIDQIALQAMRESYARQTEGKVYTLLNGSNGAGGTITSGAVPSGAQAIQSAGGTALPVDIRKQLAAYPFKRFNAPTIALMGQIPTANLAAAVGSDGRPLFPSIGAMNTSGIGNAVSQGWYVDGLAFVPAWAMTGAVGSTDTHIFILNQADAWVWESPTLLFRFEEKQGPALIELALFGYFATHLLRPVGLSGIRMTAA